MLVARFIAFDACEGGLVGFKIPWHLIDAHRVFGVGCKIHCIRCLQGRLVAFKTPWRLVDT